MVNVYPHHNIAKVRIKIGTCHGSFSRNTFDLAR